MSKRHGGGGRESQEMSKRKEEVRLKSRGEEAQDEAGINEEGVSRHRRVEKGVSPHLLTHEQNYPRKWSMSSKQETSEA